MKDEEYKISLNGEGLTPSVYVPSVEPLSNGHANALSHDPALKSHDLKQQHVAEWLFQTQHQAENEERARTERLSHRVAEPSNRVNKNAKKQKRTVYLSNTFVQFPETSVRTQSMVKVRLCNRDTVGHTFSVIRPSRPFSVAHVNFEIG